ncbi:MAG TPA: alpha/beta fold hydrolase [Stellaceae bacterium]|nr:alpha/beta fold hydrolase [Stellaceae bacterium]
MSGTDGVVTKDIAGVKIEMIERGTGRPLLFLHPGIGIDPAAPVLDRLGAGARLIAPSHPGFGRSELPRAMTTVDDLAYFYLDLMEALDLRDAAVVGVSFGAWIAAEIAVKTTERIGRLVLADALGIKVSDRETRDIADIFAMTEAQFNEHAYADPAAAKRDYAAMAEADLVAIARNRESVARFGWSPYLHDPKLKGRLRRIRVPTLVLWGASDGIVTPAYGEAYAAAIPGARFERIERAGHFPHLEQPEEFARRVRAFALGPGAAP